MMQVAVSTSRLWLALAMLFTLPAAADYTQREEVDAFIDEMVREHGFEAAELEALFAQAEHKQSIIDAITRPAERTLTWGEYRDIFVKPDRIEQGVAFWAENQAVLARAEERFGVAPEMIVAIIGVETRYGRITGGYRVLDALATLAFDYPPRSRFFRGELEQFLLLAREEGRPATELTGSYAGAMGYGQFIPSSYRAYAVDFDGDDQRDIWTNTEDAIGSVANYFARHRWRAGEPVVRDVDVADADIEGIVNGPLRVESTVADLRARGIGGLDDLPADATADLIELDAHEGARYFAGLHNFYVITRYNRSRLYAMAAYDLSQAILEARNASMAAAR